MKKSLLLVAVHLAGLAGRSGLVSASTCMSLQSKDVVIIGGGMAGLSAGRWLRELDPTLDFVIVEAQDNKRVGGRIRSNKEWFPDYIVEEGANWFSDQPNNPGIELADRYGVEYFNHDLSDVAAYEYTMDSATPITNKDFNRAERDFANALNCIHKEGNKLYLPNGNPQYDVVMDGTCTVLKDQCGWEEMDNLDWYQKHLNIGLEFADDDTSMYNWPDRKYYKSKFFFITNQEEGFQMLPEEFAKEYLDGTDSNFFMFHKTVTKIEYNREGNYPVRVTMDDGDTGNCETIESLRTIVTFSIGVQTSGNVEFDPQLKHASPMIMGDLVKVFAQFNTKFWDDKQVIIALKEDVIDNDGRCAFWINLDYDTGKNKGTKQTSPFIIPGSKILMCLIEKTTFDALLNENSNADELTDDQLLALLDPLRHIYGAETVDSNLIGHPKYPKLNKNPNFLGSYENFMVGKTLVDYFNYHGAILDYSNPIIKPCSLTNTYDDGAHNGCNSGGLWTMHLSGSASCNEFWGLVRGAIEGGKRSASFVVADIGCGGTGCPDVNTESACDDLFGNQGNGGRKTRW